MSFVPVTDRLSFVLSCLLGQYFLLLFGSMWHFLWILIDQAIYRGITPLETWRSPVKVDRFSSPAVFINPDAALRLPSHGRHYRAPVCCHQAVWLNLG